MEEIYEKNDELNIENPDTINLELSNNEINTNKKFKYYGENVPFTILSLKNFFLTFITLGLYYPWAKVEILKYHYQNTELEGRRFQFTGTGKEVFRGFIKVYALIIILYGALIYASTTNNPQIIAIVFPIFYLILLLFIPLAIHGAMRYRSSRSIYSGIHFKYIADRKDFLKMFFKGIFFMIISLGIYMSWFQVKIRKYIFDNLKFGNVSFKFTGDGADLFILHLKGTFLSYITLGIYLFWYYKNLIEFYIDNTKIIQNGKQSSLNVNISAGEIFKLMLVNILIIMFTFGLGTPITVIRTMELIFSKLQLNGQLDIDNITQGDTDDYDDASGDDFLDFFDFDML